MQRNNLATWELPLWIAMTDDDRGPNADEVFRTLPPRSALIVRGRDNKRAQRQAISIVRKRRAEATLVMISLGKPTHGVLAVDGIHIPETAVQHWRRYHVVRMQPAFLTVSAHSRFAIWRAFRLGADAALLSPVFPTRSHPDAGHLGFLRFVRLAKIAPLPIYALGGIQRRQIRRTLCSAAVGIAGIGLFADPAGLR